MMDQNWAAEKFNAEAENERPENTGPENVGTKLLRMWGWKRQNYSKR